MESTPTAPTPGRALRATPFVLHREDCRRRGALALVGYVHHLRVE